MKTTSTYRPLDCVYVGVTTPQNVANVEYVVHGPNWRKKIIKKRERRKIEKLF